MFRICTITNKSQELAEVLGNTPEGMEVSLIDEGNVHNWSVVMDGPEGSPYQVCRAITGSLLPC
jgi:ubiquitin-protein ligase